MSSRDFTRLWEGSDITDRLVIMRVHFVTGNQNKVTEASGILSPLGFFIERLLIGGQVPDLIEPQAEGIEEIAISKLEQAISLTMGTEFENEVLLVEDSGLFIDSLSGFPGPYSSFVHETNRIVRGTKSDVRGDRPGCRIQGCCSSLLPRKYTDLHRDMQRRYFGKYIR